MIGLLAWSAAHDTVTAGSSTVIYVPSAVADLAASLFVAAAGLISAGMVARGRGRALAAADRSAETAPDAGPAAKPPRLRLNPAWLAGWPQVLASMLLGGAALAAAIAAAGADDQQMMSPLARQMFGGLLILLAFPFLVLERVYANTPPEAMPDAPRIERLLRVPLVTFVGFGTASVLLSVGFEWPSLIERAIAILIGLVALELVLRGAVMVFVPAAPIATRRAVADSTVASLLRLTLPRFAAANIAVKRQFGIDLSRSWALAFVRRAAFPIVLGMVVFAWCMTGVTALGLNERAVYERLGVPVAVFGPGLHLHLPWPFGIMRSVELGVVHEIPIVYASPGRRESLANNPDETPPETGVEDIPPASADRLWDASHPAEASYLIASETQGKQSFQIVNIDLRIVYRVGLSDAAAKDAAYAIADPEALIRAMAGQLLVRYFAHTTLLDALGQSREGFSNDFRSALQDQLQALSTGIEVIAVVVEAIHPPPAAAAAYHNVQAAEIVAQSQISLRRADAISMVKAAQEAATEYVNRASAAAAELVDRARAESVLFNADREAYHRDGQTFLFERWLDRLSASLPKSSFILIDHRLRGATAPTIDLRSFALPGAADQARPAAPSASPAKPSTPPPPGPQSLPEEDGGD